jgi:hypothetical protein
MHCLFAFQLLEGCSNINMSLSSADIVQIWERMVCLLGRGNELLLKGKALGRLEGCERGWAEADTLD